MYCLLMERNKIIALCLIVLSVLPAAGCVSATMAYRTGGCISPCAVSYAEPACDPCGETGCGEGEIACGNTVMGGAVISGTCDPCAGHGVIHGQHCLSNIGNGVRLIGRGVLDAAAVPFIVVGKVLSSGCRYEVITDCSGSGLGFGDTFSFGGCPGGGCSQEVYYGDNYMQPQDFVDPCTPQMSVPCSPCTGTVTTGCSSCAGKQTGSGIEYSTANRPSVHQVHAVVPPKPGKISGVVQTSYQEPTAPVIRFVKPKGN
ncbi:MAG: hypothetical protein LBH00_05325 [Planctomycetaceae bacterium]|jgi:hypothetical protein|nr:hypothetical protein [Planctomycetaceae bacterium]